MVEMTDALRLIRFGHEIGVEIARKTGGAAVLADLDDDGIDHELMLELAATRAVVEKAVEAEGCDPLWVDIIVSEAGVAAYGELGRILCGIQAGEGCA